MLVILKNIYLFFESIPDRLYPFRSEVEGHLVRGRKSYLQAVNFAWETYGPNRIGFKLVMYRSVFHFIGSVLFIICAAYFSSKFFDGDTALHVLLGAAIVALFFQEFYSHPHRYGQLRYKSFTDWLTWAVPMAAYMFFR